MRTEVTIGNDVVTKENRPEAGSGLEHETNIHRDAFWEVSRLLHKAGHDVTDLENILKRTTFGVGNSSKASIDKLNET